jgi:hypothetical protein
MKDAGLQLIASRQFSIQDQQDFAKFSGDVNPIHLDAVYSRRTTYGQCIVHGVHSLLWALDSLYRICSDDVSKVSVNFLQPLFLDEPIICEWNGNRKLAIKSDDTTLATITVNFIAQPNGEQSTTVPHATPRHKANFELSSPRNVSFIDAAGLNVTPVTHLSDCVAAQQLFPNLCARHGSALVGEIATTSYIVGMECPGLQSLFGSLSFELTAANNERSFRILEADDRFSLLKIKFTGFFIDAIIESFYRPAVADGPSLRDLGTRIAPEEFRNVRALIIGGSRGLGEAVSKMIAAGGGEVTFTYHQGEMESLSIQQDIHNAGGRCHIQRHSVLSDCASRLNLDLYNQIFYFATPQISAVFSAAQKTKLRNLYRGFYIDGFTKICDQLTRLKSNAAVFVPSTTFIEKPIDGFEDYIEIKAEAEVLCERLSHKSDLHIVIARLPRTATDQNQSFLPTNLPDSVEVMLPYVRALSNR